MSRVHTLLLKFLPCVAITTVLGMPGFGVVGQSQTVQAQTVIYNGRTVVTDDYERHDDERHDRSSNHHYDRDGYRDGYYGREQRDSHYNRDGYRDRYGRHDGRDGYYGYDERDDYDRDSRYERYEGPAHLGHQNSDTGQDNPACLAFESMRIACQ